MQISYQYQDQWHVKSLAQSEVVVGRPNSQASVGIDLSPDTTVSRVHANLWQENGACWIEDLGSRYGTTVNGTAISGRHPLSDGDLVQIGETTLRIDAG